MKTAILVDGGFYRKRAAYLWGKVTAEKRASELIKYCNEHLVHEQKYESRTLYRIFYYDCSPLAKTVYHPLLKRGIDFRHSETKIWMEVFLNQLKKQRKVALRLGTLSDEDAHFVLHHQKLKKLLSGEISIDDLSENDFEINFQQKGVDTKICLDIASLAYKKQVDQIILISGDSDFVPAAKVARREGIDFILDPMWANIKPDLFEHIDGLRSQWGKKQKNGGKFFPPSVANESFDSDHKSALPT